ncbi:hydroxysqualene dehydroxylase HpnE [Alicyclobacillus acidiphilus]|uniref:hydroxysqualene dehydroxylase HpnE n=1 Tax=Alicyclobacillus acidiphilus TaxID=182455 RepID=UPI0008318A27|nr:hydroxysqualene dehydroxylase HpnE [Alicyclobacillus acidiphilus]
MERVSDGIAVIGAGWAGIAAVEALLERGVRGDAITVIERTPYPGGRAFSFVDRKSGLDLDNGQHVLLGCCDEYVGLLDRLDVRGGFRFQPLLDIPIYHGGKLQHVSSRRLSGPLHLLPGLLRYGHLPFRERIRAMRAAPGFLHPDAMALDAQSFGDWLRQMGQSEDTIGLLWDLVGTAVLNGHVDEISAGLAAESFRIGVVAGWKRARLGLFTRPLGDLAAEAIARLQARGVRVHYSSSVARLDVRDGRIVGLRLRDGSNVPTSRVISTVPQDAFINLLPEDWRLREPFSAVQGLRWSPILNVFLEYEEPVTDHEVFASTEMGGMFVFNRGRLLPESRRDGRWLSVSVSAAGAFRSLDHAEIVTRVTRAIAGACPRARSAKLRHASVVWQPHATFLAAPNTWTSRLDAKTPIAGLYAAGDWTNTGWPASLEGAVRSGRTAAQLVEIAETAERN